MKNYFGRKIRTRGELLDKEFKYESRRLKCETIAYQCHRQFLKEQEHKQIQKTIRHPVSWYTIICCQNNSYLDNPLTFQVKGFLQVIKTVVRLFVQYPGGVVWVYKGLPNADTLLKKEYTWHIDSLLVYHFDRASKKSIRGLYEKQK